MRLVMHELFFDLLWSYQHVLGGYLVEPADALKSDQFVVVSCKMGNKMHDTVTDKYLD